MYPEDSLTRSFIHSFNKSVLEIIYVRELC